MVSTENMVVGLTYEVKVNNTEPHRSLLVLR